MRKLVVCGFVALLTATVVGVALGKSQATTFSLKQTTRAEGASTGVKFRIEFSDPEAPNSLPSGLKSFNIKLHKGTEFDGRGAKQCKVSGEELESEGLAACPQSTRVGTGTAVATSAEGATVETDSVIFNETVGGKDALLFVFVIDGAYVTAFDAFIKGRTMSATGLTGALPGDLIVTEFTGTIDKSSKGRGERRRNLITAPSVCPPGTRRWKNTGTFVFGNGDSDSGSSTSPCKPGN